MQVHVVKGASKAEAERFYRALCSADAPLRLRRHRARLLHVQQSRERVPHLRRPRRRQADASRAARARSEAQHSRRLLRARGVQVQPGHLGRPDDVQPVARRWASRSTRRGRSCPRRRATRSSTASSRRRSPIDVAARREGQARRLGRAARSASAASRGASSATTGATGSAARRTRGWRRGSTR